MPITTIRRRAVLLAASIGVLATVAVTYRTPGPIALAASAAWAWITINGAAFLHWMGGIDPSRGFLGILATIVTLATGAVPLLQYLKGRTRERQLQAIGDDAAAEGAAEALVQPAAAGELLPADVSIAAYLDQLEAQLKRSAARERFVPLRAREVPASAIRSIDRKFEQRNASNTRAVDLRHAHKQFDHYVLLGPPGCGKSTCLERLTLDLIAAYRAHPEDEYIPIFCSLARWTNKRLSAIDVLKQAVLQLAGSRNRLATELEDLLAAGRLVVILDGLNEMPGRLKDPRRSDDRLPRADKQHLADNLVADGLIGTRADRREESMRELASSRGVRSRFVLSCRSHEFSGSVDWARVHVLPLDDEQIAEFLRLHLGEAHQELADILAQSAALTQLARNPFYLRLLTIVGDEDLSRIRNRGQFLRLLLARLLDRERSDGGAVRRFERTVGRLAFRMIDRDMIGSQIDLRKIGDLPEDVTALGIGTGLLVQTNGGGVIFYHQLIQEFFAAIAIHSGHARTTLRRMLRSDKWIETAVLYCDMADSHQGILRRLRRQLRQRNGPTLTPFRPPWLKLSLVAIMPVYGFVSANLLMDWLAGGGWLLDLVQQSLPVVAALWSPIGLFFLIPFFCHHRDGIANAAYVLSHWREPDQRAEIIPPIIEAFSRMGAARRKIVDALVDIGEPTVEWLLIGLRSRNANVRRGCIEALGRLRASQALGPLIGIVQQGDPRFFLRAVEALGQFDEPGARAALARSLEVIGPGFRIWMSLGTWTTVFGRGTRRDEELSIRLAEKTGRNEPGLRRHFAVAALGSYGGSSALPTLAAIARDTSDPLQKLALASIARLSTPDAVGELLPLIEGPRHPAVAALGAIKSSAALPALIPLLDDPRWWVRDAALSSLGRMRHPDSVPAILERLEALRQVSPVEVADALGRIASPEAFDGLAVLARDPRSTVRDRALFLLDRIYPAPASALFLDLIRDPMYPDRRAVLRMLVDAPPPGEEFRRVLVELQSDRDERLARAALSAHNRVTRGLEQRLRDIGVALEGGRLSALLHRLVAATGLPEFKRIHMELELQAESSGVQASIETGVKVQQLALRDPELARRLVPAMRTIAIMWLMAVFVVGALPVVLIRPLWMLGGAAAAHWTWTAVILAAAAASYLPGIRGSMQVRGLRLGAMALRVALAVGACALIVRWVPPVIATVTVWFFTAVTWAGALLLAQWAWSAGIVGLAMLAAIAGRRASKIGRVVRASALLAGTTIVVVALAGVAIAYWYVIGGFVVLAIIAAAGARRLGRYRLRNREIVRHE